MKIQPVLCALLLTGLGAALIGMTAAAQSIDLQFGVNGQLPYGGPLANSQSNKGLGYNSVVQPDGKIVVSMDKWDPNAFDYYFYTYRYNTDGSADTSFGNNGASSLWVGDQSKNYDLQLDADGRIVVIGRSEYCVNGICGAPQFIMMRLLPNGAVDTSFGNQGHLITSDVFGSQGTYSIPYRVRSLPGGKYLIGGRGIAGKPFVARLQNSGFPDPTYANNGIFNDTTQYNQFVDLAVDASGNSYALIQSHNYIDPANGTDSYVIKLGPNGTLDPSFGNNGRLVLDLYATDNPTSIALISEDRIIISGQHWLAFLEPNGQLSNVIPNGVQDISIPGEGAMFLDKVVMVAEDRYMVCGKVHQYTGGNYQEKAFVGQVDGQGQFRSDFNGTGYMLFDNGMVGTTGWNGKLCRIFDVDILPDGVAYGTGYRNPIAGNTLRSLFLIRLTDVPLAGTTVGMTDISATESVSAFPNPTMGDLQVHMDAGAHYVLRSMLGEQMAQGWLAQGTNTLHLGVAFSAGTYTLHMTDMHDRSTDVLRIVKL